MSLNFTNDTIASNMTRYAHLKHAVCNTSQLNISKGNLLHIYSQLSINYELVF